MSNVVKKEGAKFMTTKFFDSQDLVNDKGEILLDPKPVIANSAFLKMKDGEMVINWDSCYGDCRGFDKRNVEPNGHYYMEVTLPRGTLLIRYGTEFGRNTAPKGTPYEQLGLPYLKDTVEYHEYEVIADSIKVYCEVLRGRVAPIFDSPGGGIQYFHGENNTMKRLISEMILKRVI